MSMIVLFENFSFYHSFQEYADKGRIQCTCAAGGHRLPHCHRKECRVKQLHDAWLDHGRHVYATRLRHVPVRAEHRHTQEFEP